MATVTIPLTVVAPGSHDFGPAAVADTDSAVMLSVDRTVTKTGTQGFNGQPGTTQASIQASQSNDGGTTWRLLCAAGFTGGLFTDPDTGQPFTASWVMVTLSPGTGRQAKATVALTGASVAVAGSLTTS